MVEDDKSILDICNMVLESAGLAVDSCETVIDARRLYLAGRPDLAILDIGLPDGNGLDLLREWKSLPEAPPPVLFLTARGDLKTRLDCFAAGGYDYVQKPFAAEELLARTKLHLKIKASTDRLFKRNHELELLDRAHQDMTDMIVHDLKAPLTSIKGTLDLVRDQGLISQRSYASLVKHAGHAAEFMLLMLNDLLDMSQAAQSRLQAHPTPVDLGAMFDKLRNLFAGRVKNLNMPLVMRVPPDLQTVVADHNLTFRLLTNLIANAMKASVSGDTVEVDVARHETNLDLIVSDRGRGVPDAQKQLIFKKYETGGRTGKAEETGTGIGLAFCAAAAAAMDGAVWVEDRDGGGSRFIFRMPLKTA